MYKYIYRPSPKMSGNTSKPYVDIYTVKDMRK